MSRKIRIPDEQRSETELETLCRQLGHQWPPRHQAEAVAILTKAKFSQQRIDQFLAMNYDGFDGVGELPQGYVSTAAADGHPVFTAYLIEGLRPVVAEFNARDPWEAEQTLAAWAAEFDVSTKTIQRKLPEFLRTGQVMRLTPRGAISLRTSAVRWFKEK